MLTISSQRPKSHSYKQTRTQVRMVRPGNPSVFKCCFKRLGRNEPHWSPSAEVLVCHGILSNSHFDADRHLSPWVFYLDSGSYPYPCRPFSSLHRSNHELSWSYIHQQLHQAAPPLFLTHTYHGPSRGLCPHSPESSLRQHASRGRLPC